MTAKLSIDNAKGRDYSVETLWRGNKILATAAMRGKKIKNYRFHPENLDPRLYEVPKRTKED